MRDRRIKRGGGPIKLIWLCPEPSTRPRDYSRGQRRRTPAARPAKSPPDPLRAGKSWRTGRRPRRGAPRRGLAVDGAEAAEAEARGGTEAMLNGTDRDSGTRATSPSSATHHRRRPPTRTRTTVILMMSRMMPSAASMSSTRQHLRCRRPMMWPRRCERGVATGNA